MRHARVCWTRCLCQSVCITRVHRLLQESCPSSCTTRLLLDKQQSPAKPARSTKIETLEAIQGESRRLLLACGNVLRSDDGVGLHLAAAVETDPRFAGVEVIVAQQFTPELAELIAAADRVAFVDACAELPAGEVRLQSVAVAAEPPHSFTHHLPPAALLALAQSLYGRTPQQAVALAVGAASFELGEGLSATVVAAVPPAIELLRKFLLSEEASVRS